MKKRRAMVFCVELFEPRESVDSFFELLGATTDFVFQMQGLVDMRWRADAVLNDEFLCEERTEAIEFELTDSVDSVR